MRAPALSKLSAALALLSQHHSRASYNLDNIQVVGTTSRASRRASSRTTSDGTRLQLRSGAAASNVKEKSKGSNDKELEQIKELLTEVAKNGGLDPTHPLVQKLVSKEVDEELRQEQKSLNARRKAKKKIENLKALIAKRDQDFKNWKQGIKTLLQEESQRHEEALEKMAKDLAKLEEEAKKTVENTQEDLADIIPDTSEEESDGNGKAMSAKDQMQERMKKILDDTNSRCRQLEEMNMQLQAQLRIVTSTSPAMMPMNLSTPMNASPSTAMIRVDLPSMRPFGVERRVQEDPYLPADAKRDSSQLSESQKKRQKTGMEELQEAVHNENMGHSPGLNGMEP